MDMYNFYIISIDNIFTSRISPNIIGMDHDTGGRKMKLTLAENIRFCSDDPDQFRAQLYQIIPYAFSASPASAIPVFAGQIVSAVNQGAI